MTTLRIQNWAVSAALCCALTGCGTVPLTGRTQINIISDQDLVTSSSATFAKFYSDASSKNAILKASDYPKAASTLASVERVSNKIIDAAGLRGKYNWEIVVIKSKNANAFVMPGGKIVVFTGILPIAKNDAGLAAIIGHEVAHVVAQHAAERLSQSLLVQAALSITDVALAAKNPKYQPSISAALGLGAQYGMLLPFSRDHESEADHIGLIYMAKAGFDPNEAIGVWERMEKTSGTGPWELMSTHPSNLTRQANLRSWQSEANLFYADRARALPTNLASLRAAQDAHSRKVVTSPSAFAPTLAPGFWYVVNTPRRSISTTWRISKKYPCSAGECLSMVGSNGATTTLTNQLAVVKVENADGTWSQFSPPVRQLNFPLSLGLSWSDIVTVEHSMGKKQQLNLKFDVVSYEPVTVNAGSFMAYKIVRSSNGVRNRELWYAPETATFVKAITVDANGIESVSELSDYQKTADLGGVL